MKHNVMKRTLAGVMAVLTVAAYMPANVGGFLTEGNGFGIVASAEGELQEVNTVDGFIQAVEAGASVRLTAAITLTRTVNITKDVTIDLNGFSVTKVNDRAIHVQKGTLTLSGSGTVSSNLDTTVDGSDKFGDSSSVIRVGNGKTASDNNDAAGLVVGSNITISSNHCYGLTVFGSETVETVDIYGKVNVTGTACAISGNGNSSNGAPLFANTTINIYPGAEVTATGDVAIYHPQAGIMNITGGTITGLGGIEAKSGTVNISGDTVVKATGALNHAPNGNGTSTKGRSIAAVEHNSYAGTPTFNISGGTFTEKVEIVSDNQVNDGKDGVINITGGEFKSGDDKLDVSDFFDGATYSQDDYGYVRETAAIYWDEINDSTGKTYYNLSPDYLTVFDGETVKLRKDVTTKQIYTPSGNKGSIDLNGHNITLNGYGFVGYSSTENNFAELTIKNSGSEATLYASGSAKAQAFNVDSYSKLTVDEKVTVTSDSPWTIVPKEDSTINVYGTVTNTYNTDGDSGYAISGNHDWSMGSVINIYDGAKVEAPYGNAIYHPQDGTLNITGGTVTGATAIFARTGTINISGGKISATGPVKAPNDIANGADPTGDAVAIQVYVSSYGTVPEVNITGGSFSSVNGKSVATYWAKAIDEAQMPTKFITGGNFGSDLNKSYIADGYVLDENYDVVEATAQQVSTPVTITTIDVNGASTAETVYQEYYQNGDYTLPKNVYLDGFEFKGWKVNNELYTNSEAANSQISYLVGSGEPVIVQIVYDKIVYYSDVSVLNGTIVNISNATTDAVVETSTVVKVQANAPTSGMKFSHWLSNGKIVSYNTSYSFYAPEGDVNLEAVYVTDTSTVAQQGTGFIEKVSKPTANKMAFVSVLNVPDGCKMLKAGVVVQGTDTLNGAALTINNAKAIRYTDTSKNNYRTFKYTFTLQTSNLAKKWTVRPYLEYKDKSGKVQTIYGDSVSNCINDFN